MQVFQRDDQKTMIRHHSESSLCASGQAPLDAAVKNIILRLLPDDPSILAVAQSLSMNVRTLQRRLAEDGQSFRHLLDDCRRQLAEADLSKREHSVAEISRRLGYSDPAHFVRAFRRWTGEAPTRFCARQRAKQDTSGV